MYNRVNRSLVCNKTNESLMEKGIISARVTAPANAKECPILHIPCFLKLMYVIVPSQVLNMLRFHTGLNNILLDHCFSYYLFLSLFIFCCSLGFLLYTYHLLLGKFNWTKLNTDIVYEALHLSDLDPKAIEWNIRDKKRKITIHKYWLTILFLNFLNYLIGSAMVID